MPKIAGAFAISVASFMVSTNAAIIPIEQRQAEALCPFCLGTIRRETLGQASLGFLAVLACIDFIYRSHVLHPSESLSLAFSRTGYVDSSSARIVLRAPQIQNPFQLTYTDSMGSETKTINIPALTEDSDYTTTLELTGLVPETRYFYNATGDIVGSFKTSAASLKKFTIISTSCQKPFYPYSPFSHSLAIPGLSHLARHVESEPPELVLFLGDFICEHPSLRVCMILTSHPKIVICPYRSSL